METRVGKSRQSGRFPDEGAFEALLAAWGGDVPRGELAFWEMMDGGRRTEAAARVEALLAYEIEGDAASKAASVALSERGFFKMLRKWKGSRSLAAVVPGLQSDGRRVEDRDDQSLTMVVEDVVAEREGGSRDALVEEVRRRIAPAPAATTVRPLVDRVRAARERAALGGAEAFGRRIVAACCRVRLPVLREEGALTTHVGVVLDVATGLTLGVAASGDALRAFRTAAIDAADGLPGRDGGGIANGGTSWEVQLDGDPLQLAREVRRLYGLPLDLAVSLPSENLTEGWRLLELLGDAVGGVQLRPRIAVDPMASDRLRERMTPSEIVEARLREGLRARNALIGSAKLTVSRPELVDGLRMIGGG